VLDALYADGDTLAARSAVAELETMMRDSRAGGATLHPFLVADMCVVAQWHAAPWRGVRNRRINADINAMIRQLRRTDASVSKVPIATSPRACADIVSAMLAVARRSRSARGKVEALDELLHAGATRDGMAWANLATARLYGAIDQPARALSVVRQRPFMKGWPRYLAASLRDEATYAEKVGDLAGAESARQRLGLLSKVN
jgi:hypothetical protein